MWRDNGNVSNSWALGACKHVRDPNSHPLFQGGGVLVTRHHPRSNLGGFYLENAMRKATGLLDTKARPKHASSAEPFRDPREQ
jgi:hypothetical protein